MYMKVPGHALTEENPQHADYDRPLERGIDQLDGYADKSLQSGADSRLKWGLQAAAPLTTANAKDSP